MGEYRGTQRQISQNPSRNYNLERKGVMFCLIMGKLLQVLYMRRALEAKESKEHLILMLVKDVMFLRFCGFFLIIIIVFVCGYFVLMGSCFGWYLREAPSKNDLETREGFHNLFCCSELCFFFTSISRIHLYSVQLFYLLLNLK